MWRGPCPIAKSARAAAITVACRTRVCFRQRSGLHQRGLSFMAAAAPAEADHDGVPWAFRLGATRERGIPGGQEFKITEPGALQAHRARIP
jgi:hypothetical protein